MMTSEAPVAAKPLSMRLKEGTATLHDRMNEQVMAARPFENRASYAKFVAVQYAFQCDVEHLSHLPGLHALVSDLELRGRGDAARQDLLDLNAVVPDCAAATEQVRMPDALGWLYVSEGSTLGAAFLFKEAGQRLGLDASFGARNLAAPVDGRARTWMRFVQSLDNSALDDAAQQRVLAGACAAFGRYAELFEREFSR